MNSIKIKPCPFCQSEKIDYSIKTTGGHQRRYHLAMYCKDCNCYGPRILITSPERNRNSVERNEKYKELAIKIWNLRKPLDSIILELEIEQGYCFGSEDEYECVKSQAYENAIEIVKKY